MKNTLQRLPRLSAITATPKGLPAASSQDFLPQSISLPARHSLAHKAIQRRDER